ncbi:3-methyladenine DNA glycosylase [Zhengella mangrovi]|uniref:3-methyladenine DNA glycosylase n=1 Tax=Zhengella mangrovi TaxID=1982044 RepID=A0A2G1QHB7_9HYPH|nr:cytochrome c [Zhengella mangrovi]PHP64906.1 3-methyladenine DNA glycosylase [Zhengella mangrovi]
MLGSFKAKAACVAIGTLGMIAAVSAAHAQENLLGKELYIASCETCHGSTGLGDGGFAQYLTIKPANLRVLTKNNHGVFPYLDVFHIVDGRTGVRGHSGGPMPIWGDVFTQEIGETGSPYGAELRVRAKMVSLVDYIESLQE